MLGLPSGMGHVGAEFVPVAAVVVDEVSNLTKAWYETAEDDVAWYFFAVLWFRGVHLSGDLM